MKPAAVAAALLTRAADAIIGGGRRGFDNPRIIRACLYYSRSRGARARVSRTLVVGLCLQRPRAANARAALAPSVHQREGLSDDEREYAPLLSPFSLLSRVSVKVFQSPTAARARVLSLRPRGRGLENNNDGRSRTSRNVNDPSAGSPTETLLRLLLPLNDQVWSSSRQHRQCRRIAAHQSEDLTKSFNR